ATVTFTIASGGGAVSNGSGFGTAAQVTTSSAGLAAVSWQLGTVAGANTLTAAIPGLPGVTFNATATAGVLLTIRGPGRALGPITSSPGSINCAVSDVGNTDRKSVV